MPSRMHNNVTFRPFGAGATRLQLTLTGEWVRRPGLAPDVNSATVPASELAKLDGNLVGRYGFIEFWSSHAPDELDGDGASYLPDVSLGLQFVVAVSPNLLGERFGQAFGVVDYTIDFADARFAIVEPRGGRLTDGLGNPDSLTGSLVSNSALIAACLSALGMSSSVPASVDDVSPARNLQWFGCPAANELGRLLQHVGHVYCPHSSGLGYVAKPGLGALPTWPADRRETPFTASVVDRRPASAVFLTAPAATIHTFNAGVGSGGPAWRFVAQDPDDAFRWKSLADIPSLGVASTAVRNGFADVAESKRGLLARQVYRCIQLDPAAYDPRQSPLLAQATNTDGSTAEPFLAATVAVQDERSGAWSDRSIHLKASSIDAANNILTFDTLLGTVGAVVADPATAFTPLPASALKPTFSVEAFDSANGRKRYAAFGYTLSAGTIGAMTEAAALGQLTGFRPLTAVYSCPDLQVIYVNPGGSGASNNYAARAAVAATYAEPLVAGPATSSVERVKGYFAVEVSGRVSEVRYSQSDVRTTCVIDGHHDEAGGVGVGLSSLSSAGAGLGGGGDEPADVSPRRPTRQKSRRFDNARQQSRQQRLTQGQSGEQLPVRPASLDTPATTGFRPVFATPVAPISGQALRFTGKTISGRINRTASGAMTAANLGDAAAAVDCEIWYTPAPVVQGLASVTRPDGKLIVIASPPAGLFPVQLTKTGGGDGTKTTPATWAYTVKDLAGNTLATAQSPAMPRPNGKRAFATIGSAYYDGSTVKLFDAGEVPGTGGCG